MTKQDDKPEDIVKELRNIEELPTEKVCRLGVEAADLIESQQKKIEENERISFYYMDIVMDYYQIIDLYAKGLNDGGKKAQEYIENNKENDSTKSNEIQAYREALEYCLSFAVDGDNVLQPGTYYTTNIGMVKAETVKKIQEVLKRFNQKRTD